MANGDLPPLNYEAVPYLYLQEFQAELTVSSDQECSKQFLFETGIRARRRLSLKLPKNGLMI